MSFLSRALPKNRFAREVFVLVGGSVGRQAIMVLAAPLLTRLYTPQDFGLLAVFVALLSFFTVIACLRYELAIPLPSDDHEAGALLVLSLLAVLGVSTLIAVPLFLYREAVSRLFNTPRLADYIYLVPAGTLFIGVYNVLNFWSIRMKAFTPLAKTKVNQSLAAVGIQLGGAPFGPVALLIGQIVGYAAGSLSLILRTISQRWEAIKSVGLSDVMLVARRYKQFPLLSTWSALFNTAGAQLPPILFAALFNPEIAGIYALANRVLSMPTQLLGQAIGNVFFSDAAQACREGALRSLVANIHARLTHIGMPPTLVLLVAAPEIFAQVFGHEWRKAGVFTQWLAPWLYLVFITSPLTSVFEVLGKFEVKMVFEGILLAIHTATIVAGAWVGDVTTAVSFFAIGSAACRLAYLVGIIRVSGNHWQEIWRPSLNALAWSVIVASPVIPASIWNIGKTLWLSGLAMASVLIAARYGYLMKKALA